MSTISQALAFALKQKGIPYHWGGTTRAGGFDCSGLVWAAYTKAGYKGIGRTTYQQIKQGRAIGKGDLLPGDIVFPSTEHEGLYIGHGMVLEAPHTGDVVKVIPLSQFGFLTARRLVAGGGGVQPPRTQHGGIHPAGPQQVAQSMAAIISHFSAQAAQAQKPGDVLSRLMPQPPAQPPQAPTSPGAAPAAGLATPARTQTTAAIDELGSIRRKLTL